MTGEEFDDWYSDFCSAYPETAAFVNSNGNPRGTLEHWFAVLSPCDLTDAREVTRRMLAGDDPEVENYNRHTTPRHVATLCERASVRRRLAASQPANVRQSERSYRCLLCRDTGFVCCWHTSTMDLVAKGHAIVPRSPALYSMEVPCSCSAGDLWSTMEVKERGETKRVQPQRFDARRHFPCNGFGQADIDAMVEFVRNTRQCAGVYTADDWPG